MLKKMATEKMIHAAIAERHRQGKPVFPRETITGFRIVVPQPYPTRDDNKGRRHRAYIYDIETGKVLVSAPAAYKLLEMILTGWTYEPEKAYKEGLLQ